MPKVIINRFDNGQAEDVRTTSDFFCEQSYNFDITTKPHSLIPKRDMVAETFSGGTITDYDITDVVPATYSSTTYIFGYGRESSSSTKAAFFRKSSSSDITSAWQSVVAYTASVSTPVAGTLVEYRGLLYALTSSNLIELTDLTTITSKGNIVGTANTNGVKPLVHPEDDILYFANANVVGSYDKGSNTFTGTAYEVPTDYIITSLTTYGADLAIACKPKTGQGNSVVFIWNRDTTNVFARAVIDWGDNNLEILENLNEVLIGVSATKNIGSFTTNRDYKYSVSAYAGGSPVQIAEFYRSSYYVLKPYKAKDTNKLYFGFDTDNVVYTVGKNKQGRYFVCGESYVTSNGSSPAGALTGISLVSDTLFVSYTDDVSGYLTRTTTTYNNDCVYITTINPSMSEADFYEKKKLKRVLVSYNVKSANGTVEIGYYNDESATLKNITSKTQSSTGQYLTEEVRAENGAAFFDAYEYKFRLVSSGNVEIKSFIYEYENIQK